jgi:hypothetical protein
MKLKKIKKGKTQKKNEIEKMRIELDKKKKNA